MSFPEVQPNNEEQPLDEIDQLIRWVLLDAVAREEPSPQVWQGIKARVMARPRAMPSQSGAERPWRQIASVLGAWTSAVLASSGASWDPMLAPRERSYLIWRENLLLSMMPTSAAIIY
jgi:hypothetical protein